MRDIDIHSLMLSCIIAFAVSLTVTFVLMPWVMANMRRKGIVGKDMNKPDRPELPEMGGIGVVIGTFAGIYSFMCMYKFVLGLHFPMMDVVMAGMFCILGLAFVGALDDLFRVRQAVKAVLPVFFAIPLAIVAVDQHGSQVNLFGMMVVEIGILMYVLILFAITAAANGANMLEGYNGLGAGLSVIISGALIAASFVEERYTGLVFLVPLLGASLSFLHYNNYPARVFPGDVFTLFYGGTVAVAVVAGTLKEFGSLLFAPMIVEFFLKARGLFRAQNFGRTDGKGILRYKGPVQSLTHLMMKLTDSDEQTLVWRFWAVQLLICSVSMLLLVF